MNWGNQLGAGLLQFQKQPDAKVGDVVCYVFTSELKGRTTTLYFGKQDFLIHQVRTVTSNDAVKETLAKAATRHPEIVLSVPQSASSGIISTETHENIVLDQKFSPADFVPKDAEK